MLEVGWWGSLRDLSKTYKNRGWVKAKVVHRKRGVWRCHHPCPPENFNHTHGWLWIVIDGYEWLWIAMDGYG